MCQTSMRSDSSYSKSTLVVKENLERVKLHTTFTTSPVVGAGSRGGQPLLENCVGREKALPSSREAVLGTPDSR